MDLQRAPAQSRDDPASWAELSWCSSQLDRALPIACDAGGYTPSDFPLSGLDQETLDQFLHNTRDTQDLYPLSPMQMLFLTLGSAQPATILDQWHGTLQGDLDVAAFQRSWELVFERHAVLRSTFHEEGLSEPLQMVHQRVASPLESRGLERTARDPAS